MTNINSALSLKNAIAILEEKQTAEKAQLKTQLHVVKESINPVNLLKSVFHEVGESDEIKGNLLNSGIGLGAGILSKVLFQGVSHSPTRKFLGTVLMFGVSNFVAKHPIKIKAAGLAILDTIMENIPHRAPEEIPQHHHPK